MTVKQAIKILDWLIETDNKLAESILEPSRSWNQDFDCLKSFAQEFAEMKKRDVEIFKKIKKELVPNCKHPKKMRDKTPDGKSYCMNCNLDL
jgi:hypothetical protein